jgi:hypothetical protein
LSGTADYVSSVWAQAVEVNTSPTLVEIDVADDARTAMILADRDLRTMTEDPSIVGVGPRSVLSYASTPGGEPSVEFLEIDGAAAEAAKVNADWLVARSYETSRMTRHDPERLKGVTSGVALQRMEAPTVAMVGGIRSLLSRAWKLLSRKLAIAMDAAQEGFSSPDAVANFVWPRVFPLTAQDIQDWANAFALAIQSDTVSRETAIARMSALLEVDDPEAEAKRILDAAAERMAMLPQIPAPGGDDDDDDNDGE